MRGADSSPAGSVLVDLPLLLSALPLSLPRPLPRSLVSSESRSLRSTAVGSTYSLSRLMSGLQGFILLPVLAAAGAGAMYAIVGVAMTILIANVAALGPRTAGRRVEEINPLPEVARSGA